ncbi:MAG: rhamnulokinase [Planctomycetota bacterium]
MKEVAFVAFDLGAESGRTILGKFKAGKLHIEEINRFPNGMVHVLGHWRWNIYRLFEEMRNGLRLAAEKGGGKIESLAVDTWGVDFGLVGADGAILDLPVTYRDERTQGMMDRFFEIVPRERVYRLTGIQFMPFNSLFQLHAMKTGKSAVLEAATDLLFMPDLFNYLFTGRKESEFTFATTSQLYDPGTGDWSGELLDALDVPRSLMQKIAMPGTRLAPLDAAIAEEAGILAIPVIHAASHDTGSAVAAVPARGEGWAYISSGTWSLMGLERKAPVLTDDALDLNFTNEGGVEGTFRFLKNITGLWLLQQCRKEWAGERDYSYGELMRLAKSASPFRTLLDPDHPDFLHPKSMPDAITDYCKATKQAAPDTPAAFTRAILESLALKYRLVLEQLEHLGGKPIERIHVIGGGAKNELLCRFTADATGVPVLAGPMEATAIGNIMMQALALGHVDSHAELREVIRQSFEPSIYDPQDPGGWDEAFERFKDLAAGA